MTGTSIALCSAVALPQAGDVAPEWIHLLPAGEIRTSDGRGPYRVSDVVALMAASLAQGDKLVLDENHSTDLAAPNGASAPARGWIVELQQREDGVWGKVEWTGQGRQLMTDRAYRGVSPVIAHRRDNVITRLLRASLTNAPNFRGLASLHQEDHRMDLKSKLLELLKLDGEVDDAAIVAALEKALGAEKPGDGAVALQSALAPIAKAAGLAEGADAAAVLAGVQKLADGEGKTVTALQSELAGLTTQLNAIQDANKRDKAAAFVDAAIAEGRVGVKPQRDEYVAMHMENPARVEKLIGAMPVLKAGTSLHHREPTNADDELGDPNVIARHAADYQRKRADAGETIDFATAVMAVKEGKHK